MEYHTVAKKPVFLKLDFKGEEIAGRIDFRLKVMLKTDLSTNHVGGSIPNEMLIVTIKCGQISALCHLQLCLLVCMYMPKHILRKNKTYSTKGWT